jgi:hypothetical protein
VVAEIKLLDMKFPSKNILWIMYFNDF